MMSYFPERPLIFLDIDGVLNWHDFNPISLSAPIEQSCVKALNEVIHRTAAALVISSAWRYMILNGAMTLDGFHYMLRTHGVTSFTEIVGVTEKDGRDKGRNRDVQITRWRKANRHIGPYVVIDDVPVSMRLNGHPLVKTHSGVGLTDVEVNLAIWILRGRT